MSVEMEQPEEQPPDIDLTGKLVAGRYSILRRLGEGGMGVVYSAMDSRLEKQVAIKVLREDFATRPDVVARFTQEAKSAARIKHENVLDVTDYGATDDGSFYIAMELLPGLMESAPEGAAAVIKRLTDDLRAFVGGQPQNDDITLIVIRKV